MSLSHDDDCDCEWCDERRHPGEVWGDDHDPDPDGDRRPENDR